MIDIILKKKFWSLMIKKNQTIRHYGDWGDVCKEESYFEGKSFLQEK